MTLMLSVLNVILPILLIVVTLAIIIEVYVFIINQIKINPSSKHVYGPQETSSAQSKKNPPINKGVKTSQDAEIPSCFINLGISDINPSKVEVKKAYRQQALQSHPDRGGSSDEFEKITRAYKECLSYLGESR